MKILFIGFSVTEEKNGYFKSLENKVASFSDINVTLSRAAIGGVTFQLIPYMFETLVKERYDFIIYEIATCFRFSDSSETYMDILYEISDLTLKSGAIPCFANMYRTNIDYDVDILSSSVEFFSKINGYPFIDLSRAFFSRDIENLYLRDGIHTNDLGADFYAEKLFVFIKEKLRSFKLKSKYGTLFLSDLLDFKESKNFERGGVETSYIEIFSGERIEVNLDSLTCICGIFYIQGPDSGLLKVQVPNLSFSRTIHMFDEHCYYNRYGLQYLPNLVTDRIVLEQLEQFPNVKLNKGEFNGNSRIANVVGFFVRNNS